MTDHLGDEARDALGLPIKDRIKMINLPRWIGYPRADQILAHMGDLIEYPENHRMPNLLIFGKTNNGKTLLAKIFASQFTNSFDEETGIVERPILYFRVPAIPSEGRFFATILDELGARYSQTSRAERLEKQALRLIEHLHVRMLILDEVQHMVAGGLARQRALLNVIKNLGSAIEIPIVALGTDEAQNAIRSDQQVRNRFEPMELPRWEDNDDFKQLLASFEYLLPLKHPSDLPSPKLAARIFRMTEGLLGEVSTLLSRCAIEAVRSGEERITEKLLAKVIWTPPFDR